jgi:Helix-turn-helix domain
MFSPGRARHSYAGGMSSHAPGHARVIPLRPVTPAVPAREAAPATRPAAPAPGTRQARTAPVGTRVPVPVPSPQPERRQPGYGQPEHGQPGYGQPEHREPLWRHIVGDVLRRERLAQERRLKDVADEARISMPYLSEIERGRKEASSEVLAAAAHALGLSLADLLALGQDELARVARGRQRARVDGPRAMASLAA